MTTETPPDLKTPAATGEPSPAQNSMPEQAPVTPAPAHWPDNWRDKLAGEDKKALETLARFTDPSALYKSYTEMRSKLSDRSQYQKTLPKDATPEQLKEYREHAGIPENWEGYKLDLGEKVTPTEIDQQIFKDFMQYAHQKNMTPEALNTAAGWYMDFQQRQTNALLEKDAQVKTAAEDQLRQEWGGDYRANMNAISNLLAGAPKEVESALLSARTPEGISLANDSRMLAWLASLSRELNPAATLVPGAGGDDVIKNEIAKIRQTMKDDIGKYWADSAMQQRYAELIDTQNKLIQRGRGAA